MHPARGAFFENHVIAEVAKAYIHHRREPPIWFWRDRTGHEVDLLIDDGGTHRPVEIESGRAAARDMFDGLVWWSRQAGQDIGLSTLVTGGSERSGRGGIALRPWFAI